MKKILGLDLGTNSIGWAIIEKELEKGEGKILGMGSRIIPMDAGEMGKFEGGAPIETATSARTGFRSTRHVRERVLLRRERLHRVLNVLGFLPEHYAKEIDFKKRLGQFIEETEPKIVWRKNGKKKNGKDKFEFVFQELFDEMLADFKQNQPELLNRKNRKGEEMKIPYDWTIYYLRKIALERAITKEQLAWLILNFNQKRGYYQLRGEEEEKNDSKKEFVALLKVVEVEKGEVDKQNVKKTWYSITFSNGWKHSFPFTTEPNWLNTEREFLIVEEYDENGNIKIVKDKKSDTEGKENRKISSLPSFEEIDSLSKADQDKIYKKIKVKTQNAIKESGKTVGSYIYDTLLKKPNQKIRGKLIRTIERDFYKEELNAILKKQIALQPDLFKDDLYSACVRELYRSNKAHQLQLSKRNFLHLIVEDILFYQRPLKSQKSTIGNCSLEFRLHKINKKDEKGIAIKNVFEKDKDGKDIEVKEYLKGIPKSNPYYQEFRVWQWLYNLKIYRKEDDKEVTKQFIADRGEDRNKHIKDLENLFDFLMTKKEVTHKDVLEYLLTPELREKYPAAKPKAFNDQLKKEIAKYRWNYVFDDSKEKEEDKSKKYPMNETGYEIRKQLDKVPNVTEGFLKIVDTKEVINKMHNEKTTVSLGTREYQLWHIIYSVNDPKEFKAALKSFANKFQLDETSFVEHFKNFKPFPNQYGSYSEKAIKKLLPLIRTGNHWDEDTIVRNSSVYFKNIQQIIERLNKKSESINESEKEAWSKPINKELYDELSEFLSADVALFQGLRLHIAQYLVYGRHSEAIDTEQWKTSHDVQKYLYEFKQHSLRNPIVEQVVTETLRVVKDIWEHYGEKNNIPFNMVYDEVKQKNVKSYQRFFDEIHIELGREMKNSAEDRKAITNQVMDNENTNLRIKKILLEFAQDDYFKNQIEYKDKEGVTPDYYKKGNNPVRPYSQSQQEILKIYEEGVVSKYTEQELKSEKTGLTEKTKDGKTKELSIYDIAKKSSPTQKEVEKYKLWLEQKYRSPYTGEMIPLGKLFTPEYEIEHIIPKSRYFDDSLSNKVICEAAVNQLKDKQLGLEFIKNHHGQKVETVHGETVTIFTEDGYKDFVKEHYDKNRSKKTKLLLEDIPDKMIARQMNDTRYISKFISNILSNIVRAANDDDGVNSKNVIPGNGKITSTLKQDWGLNDVWNELILPRFERMNELTKTDVFTKKNKEGHTIPAMPLELSKGFQKKRIDHRHHALDALVIACATIDHVNLLNNQSAKSETKRYDLQHKLRNKEKWTDKNGKQHDKFTEFKKPWDNFTKDAKNELEKIVVSFKQNLRVINKATNSYVKFENGKKVEKKQGGVNWAVRKPLHKAFVFGKVDLPWVKVPKGKTNVAIRRSLSPSIEIDKITDTGIQKILSNYLLSKGNNREIAFSPEGIEEMNKNISKYNDGKYHQPIYKVRTYELSSRFPLGQTGNKRDKYVETADGTNMFFSVYETKDKKRMFDVVPLNEVIEHQKQQQAENTSKSNRTPIPIKKTLENRNKHIEVDFRFSLSPNDLVYVPTKDEQENINSIDFNNLRKEQANRIYRFTDGSDTTAKFVPVNIASVLFDFNKDRQRKIGVNFMPIQNEIGVGSQESKNQNAITGEQIKKECIKLKVDRLGNISKA